MKFGVAILLITVVIALPACKSEKSHTSFVTDDSRALHEAIVKNYWADQTEDAIARGAAIYPYHFELNSSELNELGEYEVSVLARSGHDHALTVHLARGDATEALYKARMTTVRDALVSHGADAGMLAFNDQLPGGQGMTSDRVRMNAERENDQLKAVYGAAISNSPSNSN